MTGRTTTTNANPHATAAVTPDPEPVDVLLINPPWLSKDANIWHGIKAAMPPLALLSIGAYAESAGLKVRIFDTHVQRWSIEQFRAALRTVRPSYVGITMLTATSIAANRVARVVKELHPDCTVVVGGAHAEALPEECLRNSAIDVVVRGDGEHTFAALASGHSWRDLRGISFRDDHRVVHNPPAEVIRDLDSLPMPAYHLVPMDKYYPALGAYRRLPAISMLMTRGCPGQCTFCNSARTVLRTRSAELVVNEIAHLRATYGIREIQFYDDTFTVMKKNVLRFCELMAQRRLGVSWTAFVRPDCFSREMAQALRRGGCHQVMFGVESGDEQILRNIKKAVDMEKTRWAIGEARRAGLEVRAAFMLGNPGETVETMQRTIDYALDLDPDLAIFNITTPYPGSEMYEWARDHGYLRTEDWGEYELGNPVMRLPTVEADQVTDAYAEAHRRFYGRPIMVWRRLKRIRNLRHLTDNIHAFFYIVLRRSSGKRDFQWLEWIEGCREDFWDTHLEGTLLGNTPIRTNQVHKLRLPQAEELVELNV